jgi:hypothetical protein
VNNNDNWGEPFPGEGSQTAFIPSGLTLNVSPNPFNPVTVASFELPVAGQVSLRVYDTAGRLVTTLEQGWKAAGSHQVVFDGTGLASGVYLYRLEAAGMTASGKMLLLK